MLCVEFCQFSVCVFISVVCYIVGIEFLFSFCSRQQDERNRRVQPDPPGRCFPTVVNFFVPRISTWRGLLFKC